MYFAGELAVPFLDSLQSEYTGLLRTTSRWVVETFQVRSDESLEAFMRSNWTNWGSEFSHESLVRGLAP